MELTLLTADDVRRALPMDETVAAMKAAFAALSTGAAHQPHRMALEVPSRSGTTFIKGAAIGERGLGAKLVSTFSDNPKRGLPLIHGVVILLDPETGAPRALIDGTFLTAWRTGAGAGAATDLLARRDARVMALLGCGAQAGPQVLAVAAVRDLEEVRVYARTPSSVAAFVEKMQPELAAYDCRIAAATSPAAAVRGADIVTAVTTSEVPVFDGNDLGNGVHINGVGSYTLSMREIDGISVERSRIFVDEMTAALVEAGDLDFAVREGRTRSEEWTEIGLVAAGQAPGRRDDKETTFFKSVGVAVQDVEAAALALERAREMGLGRTVKL